MIFALPCRLNEAGRSYVQEPDRDTNAARITFEASLAVTLRLINIWFGIFVPVRNGWFIVIEYYFE